MVAKLPDTRVLGNAPGIRPADFTPRLNVSNWSSGDAAVAAGLQNLGRGIAGMGAGFDAQQDKAATLEEAAASADFSIAKDNVYTKLSTDPDYEKAPQTYREESTKALNESAARIRDPYKQQMFIERGRVGIETNANNLQQRAVTLKNQQTIVDNDGRLNELATQALANPDETYRAQKLEEAQKILRSELDNRLITPKEYRARNKAFIERYGESFGNDLINRDPAKALEQLDKIIPREAPVGPQSSVTPAERDILIRTVLGEAGAEPDEGKAAVAHVIMNRRASGKYGGNTVDGVVLAPSQFEPWQTRRKELEAIDPNSPEYQKAAAVVDGVLSGKTADPTRGATHFYSPSIMEKRGGPPKWAAGKESLQIGGHAFLKADDLSGRTIGAYLKQGGTTVAAPKDLDPAAGQMWSENASVLKDQGIDLKVSSTYRDQARNAAVGGARGSQHIQGKAIDIPLDGLSDQQKQAVVQQFLSDPRVKGFGYYPKSDSIHVDVRDGDGRAAWGSDYTNKTVGQGWPGFITKAVTDWQGGKQYASLNTGVVSDATDATAPAKEPTEGVQVAQAQTGTPLDFLRPDQIVRLRQKAEQSLRARALDEERAIRLEERERKRVSDQAEDGVRKSIFENQPITAKEIVNNSQLTREAQDRLIALIGKVDKPEPPSTVSARTARGLLDRMRLPEGDPNRLTNVGEIYDAYTREDGGLTKADFEFVRKEFTELRSETGDKLGKRKTDFINSVKGQITKSNPLMGKIDTSGDQQLYHFDYDVQQKVDQYRKDGKNPHDLFDPSKPDYLGKPENIAPYQKTLQQSLQDRARALSGRPVAPSAAPTLPVVPQTAPKIEPRKPGESPAEYLKRTGKL